MIDKPGYYDIPLAEYLSDPCSEPSLSTSTVEALVNRSPLHAHLEHPRLGGKRGEATARGDIGSAVHALATGNGPQPQYVTEVTKRSGTDKGQVFVPTDWKTKDAQEAQAAIRDAGRIPLLPHQATQIEASGKAAKAVLFALGDGKPEVTLVFQFEGVWLRGRTDWLCERRDVDLKTCDSADPVTYVKQIYSNSLDIQMAIRWLGHQALTERNFEMIWALQEIEPPYASSVLGMSEEMVAQGVRKVRHAAKLWRKCLDSKSWPGYSGISWAQPASWAAWDLESRGVE